MAVMNWAYIAGFFDGEGSVGTCPATSGRHASVYIAQSGARGLLVLEEIREFISGWKIKSSVFCTGKATQHMRTMPSYRLGICGFTSTVAFLRIVFPYLRIKKAAAQDLIRYDKMFPSVQKSPLARAYRRERQIKCMVRGDAWHARYDGRVTGRPKGSLDKGPRQRRAQ